MIAAAVTGSIGCGKSTVARLLAGEDGVLIDVDRIVHELLAAPDDADGAAPDDAGGVTGRAVPPVLARFPEAAAADGGVDRKRLAAVVFEAPARRRELERILHPLVIEESRARIESARRRGARIAVCEVPLLFEAADAGTAPGSLERFDVVVAVTCDESVRWRRLAERHGDDGVLSDAMRRELEGRAAAQLPQEEKARRADHVVDNSGDRAALEREVAVLRSRLLEER